MFIQIVAKTTLSACILKEYKNKQAVLINNKKCNKRALTIRTNKLQNIRKAIIIRQLFPQEP